MSFGGFGGVPRKPGGNNQNPDLGVIRGIQPGHSRPAHKPNLGPTQDLRPLSNKYKPTTMGPPSWTPSKGEVVRSDHPLPYSLGPIAPFHVVILSKLEQNLKACLAALFACEKDLPQERVIVVDDGAAPGCVRYFPRIRYVKGAQPFVFARNANLGLQEAGGDVVLLNDDALIMTPGGLSELSKAMTGSPHIGISSASIFNGMESGLANQGSTKEGCMRRERKLLPFICVYLPKRTIDAVGYLDEQFSGYGYDDNDYCRRVSNLGMSMGIFNGCIVDHGKKERSTYRIRGDINAMMAENKKKFDVKWGTVSMLPPPVPFAPAPAPAAAPAAVVVNAPPPPAVVNPWDSIRVSCILTSYNRPRLIRQALKSLQDQTHKNFEVLLFDDSSQMDVLPIVGEFTLPVSQIFISKVTPLQRRSINRLSVNINRGLLAATGHLICFLADDDYYFPTWFAAAAKFFFQHPNVNVGYGKLIYSTRQEMEFTLTNERRWPGTVLVDPYERVDHNQVIHRRFSIPFVWPENFKTVTNPDAHYFRAVGAYHPFHPIDAYAAVKRMHKKNLQKTVGDVVSERAENIRE